jgi:hypothetical protein
MTLTPADADRFWEHLRRWQVTLGLSGWRITRSKKPAPGVLSQMEKFDFRQQQVSCRLGPDWKSTDINDKTLEQTAVHELLHVLLYSLIEIAKTPGADEEAIAAAEHSVINVLESVLVPVKD